MDPASSIGLASSILTFIDIGYQVVTGSLEIAETGRAPHTEHIDAVAHDLENAVATLGQPVPPSASDPEKALEKISVRCQTLLTELLTLLERFKVSAAQPGISWEKFKVVIRRMRNDSKVQELQRSLAEYRSQILVHLVAILNDRQLATQVQLGNAFDEARTDLHGIRDALENVRTEILDNFERFRVNEQSMAQPVPGTGEPLPGQIALLDKTAMQFQEVKDALDLLAADHSVKTVETRILEHVYFGSSMFQREETLKPANEATFRWFVEGVSNGYDDDSASTASEGTDRRVTPQISPVEALKAEAASRFEQWLRSGHGVFHVSGKAGSGKSTLMKLILSIERTYELLREWAGDKRLLFARFYFWAAGDQMQNSLEGLQRSILFEILIQRPDLVKDVFREAYPIVAHSSWDSPIHSRFFTTASFQKAFERLMHLPADPRYRLCLFIDGLDEYGADATSGSLPETQREDLAHSLADWASNEHVKVLASSRPYPEFIDSLAENQRIHLHQLTHDDMVDFGHHVFERHRIFRFPGVKERYKDLVGEVVRASGGVFLWTGLTIQRLLASLARRDSFESVRRQLEATPRDLNVLYDRMFSEIDEHDRHEAMKMMLLVSEEQKYLGRYSHPQGVNAMAISWLEPLEDPEFPANQPFVVYTEEEIEEKRKFAESRVNGYTRGLLEVTTSIVKEKYRAAPAWYNGPGYYNDQWPLHLRDTVQFFHRTALEYVTASPLARYVLSSSPSCFNLEFYTRLSLAELHIVLLQGSGPAFDLVQRHKGILSNYFQIPNPCQSLIEAYRAAFEEQARYFACSTATISLNHAYESLYTAHEPDQSFSFDHWVASTVKGTYAAQYLTERFQNLHDPRSRDGLSLLLSVACRDSHEVQRELGRPDRVKMVLELGANPSHHIRFRLPNTGDKWPFVELSVWQVWCLYYEDLDRSQILEHFLATGVDSDCYILMRGHPRHPKHPRYDRPGNDNDRYQSRTAYVISLGECIRQVKPVRQGKSVNYYDQLEQLLGEKGYAQEFSRMDFGEIESELASSQHPEFKNPTVGPIDVNLFFHDTHTENLMVYWIRWKDVTIPGNIEFRLY